MQLSKSSPNHKFILGCARLAFSESMQREIISLKPFLDWDIIMSLAIKHKISPFLYYNLSKINSDDFVPAHILETMKNHYYANLKRNLVIEKEITAMLQLANHENMDIILLKGIYLLQTLYLNPGLRTMSDVDMLVKNKDFAKIKRILSTRGFQASQELSEEHAQKYQYETLFSKDLGAGYIVHIEVHTSLNPPRPFPIQLPLWERARENALNSQRVLSLSPEDTFLSLALHLRRHTRRLTLRFIIDIAEFLNKYTPTLDWVYIENSARNNRIASVVYFALYASQELFDTAVPASILDRFRLSFIKTRLFSALVNKYNFFFFEKKRGIVLRLMFFDSFTDFLFYIFRVMLGEKLFSTHKRPR